MAEEILTPAKFYVQADNSPSDFLSPESLTQAVAAALVRYGMDDPNETLGQFPGAGSSHYDLSDQVLPGWVEAESSVTMVDYPYSLGGSNILDDSRWAVIEAPGTGKTLCFLDGTPQASESIVVKYSIPWTEDAVPARHIPPVAKLAAANMARMMAARRAQAGESTLSADTFGRPSDSQIWLSLAKSLERQYEEETGLVGADDGKSTVKAASGTVSMHDDMERLVDYGEL